jgi:hypothetical protein
LSIGLRIVSYGASGRELLVYQLEEAYGRGITQDVPGTVGTVHGGRLGRAIGLALPGESPEELERIAEGDRRKAEEGLVELRSGDEVWYKHIDELTREDRPARIESENARAAWIQERLRRQPRPQ